MPAPSAPIRAGARVAWRPAYLASWDRLCGAFWRWWYVGSAKKIAACGGFWGLLREGMRKATAGGGGLGLVDYYQNYFAVCARENLGYYIIRELVRLLDGEVAQCLELDALGVPIVITEV